MSTSSHEQSAALPEADMEPTIVLRGISKWFSSVVAVNNISLQVYPGITGLLGPNGAGKTTLLHMIAGLMKPSEGEVRLFGESPHGNYQLNQRIGVMTEHESVYGFYTGLEFIDFSGRLYGITPLRPAVERAIESVGLTDVKDRPLNTYSRGMKQRMRMAAALVNDPEVLLLDEPLSGTDPRQRLEFQNLMRRLASEGRTILISSHILEEVETLAERILLMVSGKLAASGDFHTIRAKLDERPYRIRILVSDPRAMASALMQMDKVDSITVDAEGSLIILTNDVQIVQRAVPRLAQEHGIRLFRFEPLDDSLESVFSYIVER
ncbi:ABC transporter ATP-binding protein [Chloroflexota bacterium]